MECIEFGQARQGVMGPHEKGAAFALELFSDLPSLSLTYSKWGWAVHCEY